MPRRWRAAQWRSPPGSASTPTTRSPLRNSSTDPAMTCVISRQPSLPGSTRQSMPQLLPLGARIDPRVKPAAVRFSFSLQLYEGAEDTEDTCTTDGPPWPDLFRPPASLNAAPPTAGTAWMATDQVRGLKAHGPSPAKGSSGCIERATNNRFRSTGQPWVKPGHGEEEDSR